MSEVGEDFAPLAMQDYAALVQQHHWLIHRETTRRHFTPVRM